MKVGLGALISALAALALNNQNITAALNKIEQSVTAIYHELRSEEPPLKELQRHENLIFETISNLQPEISHAYQAL